MTGFLFQFYILDAVMLAYAVMVIWNNAIFKMLQFEFLLSVAKCGVTGQR